MPCVWQVSYNFIMKIIGLFKGMLFAVLAMSVSGCAIELPAIAQHDQAQGNLVMGRAVTVLTGERSRRYVPQLRFFELESLDSSQRYQIEIQSADQPFVLDLPVGQYRLIRAQFSEGPFLSMAELPMTFSVVPGAMTYVGTWRFAVDAPGYGRDVVLSVIGNEAERLAAHGFLHKRYANYNEHLLVERFPQPSQVNARVYEVMPYPRYSRYFRRHW